MSALPAIGDMSGQCGATKSLRGVKAQRVVTTGAFRIHFRNKLWPSCHASNCALMRSSATALVYRGLGVLVARCPMSRPHTKNHQRPSVHMRPAAKLALVTFCSPCSPKFHRLFDRPPTPCVARGAGATKRKAAVKQNDWSTWGRLGRDDKDKIQRLFDPATRQPKWHFRLN